jgi:hypothetical protein
MLSIIRLSVIRLSVIILSGIMLNVIMLSFIRLSVIRLRSLKLSVIRLSVIMLNAIMLSVIRLSVMAPSVLKKNGRNGAKGKSLNFAFQQIFCHHFHFKTKLSITQGAATLIIMTLSITTLSISAWTSNQRGRLSTVDLLIAVGCFVKQVNNVFIIKSRLTKQVSARRSTALRLPLQKGLPDNGI